MVLNWVELDGAALRGNLREFRRRLGPGVRLGAVVKANAYGHGMTEVAALARKGGADWLCVNSVEEAVRLRDEGHDCAILVMGYVPLGQLGDVVERDLRPVVHAPESLERLEELACRRGRPIPVHLKVETGTQRRGIPEPDIAAVANRVVRSSSLELEGICTHFANIEDTTDHAFAERQIEAFSRISEGLQKAGIDIPIRHTACSAATLLFTRTHLDLARIGISLYGLWPSRETYVACLERGKPALGLQPVMTWKTRVAQIKAVPEGSYVGYGCTYRTTRDSRIAVLPVGYSEGYSRSLSGVAHVLIRGRRAPIRGRVCMNMCMADVTDIEEVRPEEEVVLLGRQGEEEVSAEQLAAWSGTISYEAVARVHPALPRVVK